MTTEQIREIYGNDFLNELSLFLDDATQFDEVPEKRCKRLIVWLHERDRCIALMSKVAMIMGAHNA